LNVPGPFLTAGDTIQTSFSVTPLAGDINPANNYYSLVDTVVASYDPNGITVSPESEVIPCTPLQYAVRFENTGNDTAYNISVVDTLSDNVNPKSLKIVSATSVVNLASTAYSGHTVVKFDFPHINLPDSAHHDLCFGEVIFAVDAKAGLADGSVITNHASIYFDDNLPVLTDTVTDIVGMSSLVGPGSVCVGSSILLTDASANGTWSSANTNATVTSGLISGRAAGMDTIGYALSNTCLTRSATKVVTINAVVAASVSINSSTGMSDTVCTGTSPVFTAVPSNGGPGPDYQWTVNGSDVSTDSTYGYIPSNGDTVSLLMVGNAQCSSPDTANASLVLTVLSPVPPTDSLIATQGIMISPGTTDTFVAIITSAGSTPTFEWLVNGLPVGDSADTFMTSTLSNGDSVTCITTSTGICQLASFNSFIITVTTVGVNNLSMAGGVIIYPNPNNGQFTIKGSINSLSDGQIAVEISDMVGQVVYSGNIKPIKGVINEQLNLSGGIASGMYILTLRTGSENKVYHFVIE
jgi:uncharacterized repeat protein (TIGR01451 family)